MRAFVLFIMIAVSSNLYSQELRFATILSDHAVLQQNSKVKIWGTAKSNAVVSLKASWLKSSIKATASDQGEWIVWLPTPKADMKSHIIEAVCGTEAITINDVVLGEVWLCSGQSNMEMALRTDPQANMSVYGSDEIFAEKENRNIRMITIERNASFEPQHEITSTEGWKVQNRDNAPWFSAVGYFFGKHLFSELKIPIGMIVSVYGGTSIQSWLPQSVTKQKDLYSKENNLRKTELKYLLMGIEEAKKRMINWIEHSQGSSTLDMISSLNNIEKLPTIKLPDQYSQTSVGSWLGGMLLSKQIEIDEVGDIEISLAKIDRIAQIYWNSNLVWERILPSEAFTQPQFIVKSEYVTPGKTTISINLISYLWNGGLLGGDDQMWYKTNDGKSMSLAGEWHYRKTFDINKVDKMPCEGKADCFTINSLYNAMIYPVHNYTIKGVLWYQGEGNIYQAKDYPYMMADMVEAWRKTWGYNFPFYYVQITPYKYSGANNTEAALMFESMAIATEIIPNSGVVITTDLGDVENIHPPRKTEVGDRLARLALHNNYGFKHIKAYSSQVVKTSVVESKVELNFNNSDLGLVVIGNAPDFELSDDDIVYYPASCSVIKSKVVVNSPKVANPKFVRYCWRNAAKGTLFCSDSMLPISTFKLKLD